MPALSMMLALGGVAAQATGQITAGGNAEKAGEYNANLALEDAAVKESQQRLQDRAVLAKGAADVGSSGVTMSGSALDVMAQSARNAEMNALIIRRGGVLQAYAARVAGANAQAADNAAAFGTILNGGTKIAQSQIDLRNLRVPVTNTGGVGTNLLDPTNSGSGAQSE